MTIAIDMPAWLAAGIVLAIVVVAVFRLELERVKNAE